MHEKAFRSDSLTKKSTLYENLTSIKISYQIPAISSCLFYLILRELYITLIGILSHTETPVMINCLLGVLSCVFFTKGIQITHVSLPSGRDPFREPPWNPYLPELLHLLAEVWIKLLGHVLHPQ